MAGIKLLLASVLLGGALLEQTHLAEAHQLHELMMEATIKVVGQKNGEPGKLAIGTMFILGKPAATGTAPALSGAWALSSIPTTHRRRMR